MKKWIAAMLMIASITTLSGCCCAAPSNSAEAAPLMKLLPNRFAMLFTDTREPEQPLQEVPVDGTELPFRITIEDIPGTEDLPAVDTIGMPFQTIFSLRWDSSYVGQEEDGTWFLSCCVEDVTFYYVFEGEYKDPAATCRSLAVYCWFSGDYFPASITRDVTLGMPASDMDIDSLSTTDGYTYYAETVFDGYEANLQFSDQGAYFKLDYVELKNP